MRGKRPSGAIYAYLRKIQPMIVMRGLNFRKQRWPLLDMPLTVANRSSFTVNYELGPRPWRRWECVQRQGGERRGEICQKSSCCPNEGKALVEFQDRRASTRLALMSNEQNRARKFREHAVAAPQLFTDDEGTIGIETNRELKRRKIDRANICNSPHRKLLHCSA